MLLGYDKLVAISSTVVSMLVGFIGGVFVTFRDPNSYYGYSATTIEKMTNISNTSLLLPKLILLVLGIALLIFFIKKHIKNVNDKVMKLVFLKLRVTIKILKHGLLLLCYQLY